jgi:hypothetical protein
MLSLHRPTSNSSVLLVQFALLRLRTSRGSLLPRTDSSVNRTNCVHLYSQGTDMHHRKHMSRGHHPTLRDVTADTKNTSSSIVA